MSNPLPAASASAVPSEPVAGIHATTIKQLLDGETVWDKRLIALGNHINPLLIKETRQALKSKQFSITFSLLIVVTGLWTVLTLLFSIPEIYYASNGVTLLNGYLFILIVPAILIIPQSSFHSMSSELGEGTFETLSLSLLSPWKIVLGKLSVAILQLVIYLSVLLPCIVLTYLLRGVTLGDIVRAVSFICLSSIVLSTVGIALATAARNRGLQFLLNIIFLLGQLIYLFYIYSFTTYLFSRFGDSEGTFLQHLIVTSVVGIPFATLMCTIASVQISGASINKATPVRRAALFLGIAIAAAGILGIQPNQRDAFVVALIAGTSLSYYWAFAGGLMVGEQGFISIRAKRELPADLMSRIFLSWFIPGPGTGYIFSVLSLAGCLFTLWLGVFSPANGITKQFVNVGVLLTVMWMYVASTLGIGRFIASWCLPSVVRWRMLTTFVAIVIVHCFLAIGAALLSNFLAGYSPMSYQFFCVVNPYWTLTEMVGNRNNADMVFSRPEVLFLLLPFTVIVFILNLLFASRGIVLQRLATPSSVLEQRRSGSKKTFRHTEDTEIVDPLA